MKPSFSLYIFLVPLISYIYLYRVFVKKHKGKRHLAHLVDDGRLIMLLLKK
jgi:hypothetical protein